jgi:hypothetical protein
MYFDQIRLQRGSQRRLRPGPVLLGRQRDSDDEGAAASQVPGAPPRPGDVLGRRPELHSTVTTQVRVQRLPLPRHPRQIKGSEGQ